ncbi:polysaccharide biosynthesis/export family protein [Microvirga mediterraneensis]|uniref:Polysaccharide biosynthesis/export family protein n=1 Tax=Microvirga mediterraneensis TaxID=2754695 RepID=A0A838BPR8_9HYPH|nr:polysaccharide biosynthesis/export family protein [Microvirga mediterraneensis]MBA1157015.1 polysaccharide biosynthesis/export family protein [Microvirga mediterraneensis]
MTIGVRWMCLSRSHQVFQTGVLRHCAFAALATVFTLGFSAEGKADFLLGVGDVVEVSIAGIPDLRARAMVNTDGNVIIPIIGSVSAAGLDIASLRKKLQDEFSTRAISVRSADGRTVITPVSPEEVSLTIAEYRPVYMSGDLARAGEVAYRPGMTVRQAVSVAGGYDVVRFRVNNPQLEAVTFSAEYTTLEGELAQALEKKKQLQLELGIKPEEGEDSELPRTPAAQAAASLVAQQFQTQREDFDREVKHLQDTYKRVSVRTAFLNQQKDREEEGMKADVEELDRAKALLERGTTSTQRVSEARRAMLASATRALQTGAEAAQASLVQYEADRAVEKLQEQRHLRLLEDLQETNTRLIRIRAQLNAAKQKLAFVGAMKSTWSTASGPNARIMIHRNVNGESKSFLGTGATLLMPGDAVEVALQGD